MEWVTYLKLALEILKLIAAQLDKKPGLAASDSEAGTIIAKKLESLAAKIRKG